MARKKTASKKEPTPKAKSTSKKKATTKGKPATKAKATAKGKAATKAKAAGKKKAAKPPLIDHLLMKALAHEDRVRCLAILNERIASPNEMSEELEEGLSQISYHVKVLREYGMIELEDTAPRRGAIEHFYRATHRALIPADTWKDLPAQMQRGISGDILRNFFDDVSASREAEIFDHADSHLSWTPMILDKKGFKQLDRLMGETLEGVFDIQAEAVERMKEEGKKEEEGISATVALASFLSARSPKDGKKAFARLQR